MPHNRPQGNTSPIHRPSRRDFLGLMGVALGSAVLGGCGSGTNIAPVNSDVSFGGATGALPNGYRFTPMYKAGTGRQVANMGTISPLTALNNRGNVFVYAEKGPGYGVFQLTPSSGSRQAGGLDIRPLVGAGDVLADGRKVARVTSMDVNNQDTVGVVVQSDWDGAETEDSEVHATDGVYLERNGSGSFEPLTRFGEHTPNRNGLFGGAFGDIDVSDGDNVLLTGFFADEDSHESRDGLFFFPHGEASSAEIIVASGDAVPGSTQTVRALGLVDSNNEGTYSLQVTGDHEEIETQDEPNLGRAVQMDPAQSQGRLVVVGRVGTNFTRSAVLSHSPKIQTTRSAGGQTGESFYGARSGGGSHVAAVTHIASDHLVMTLDRNIIARTGFPSPSGATTASMLAPVMGPNGLCFFELITNKGKELCVSNGQTHRTILSLGDKIDGLTVSDIVFGFHTDQVDSNGRVLCYVELEGQPTLLIGEPA